MNRECTPPLQLHLPLGLLTGPTVKWCLDNGISSQITTPVSEQDLASALISALESNTVTPVVAENDVPYDILIAEDNLVNQKLAVKILEKYGHQVEIAENGQLAVDAFKARVQRNRPFDVILVSLEPPIQFNLRTTRLTVLRALFRWMFLCRSWAAWKPRSLSVPMSRPMAWSQRPSLRSPRTQVRTSCLPAVASV